MKISWLNSPEKMIYSLIILFTIIPLKLVNSQWVTGSVDTITHDITTDFTYSPNSIDVDNENTLHVVWQKREIDNNYHSYRIYYSSKKLDGGWTFPIAVSDTLKEAHFPSIKIDKNTNKVYIIYSLLTRIILASSINNSWHYQRINNEHSEGSGTSFDIDANGKLHIAWSGWDQIVSGNRIFYSNNVSGQWEVSALQDTECNYPTISVTPSGKAHIAYYYYSGGTYRNRHVSNAFAGSKQFEYEDIPVLPGNGIIKVSKIGIVHYVQNYTEDFQFPFINYYLKKTNDVWSAPQVMLSQFDGVCTSVDIDENGHLHISLDSTEFAFGMGNVYYATNKSGQWKIYPVVTDGNIYYSNLKIDNFGIGHVIGTKQIFKEYDDLVHFESSDELIGINENSSIFVNEFRLFQNYPNPFNPVTNLRIEISDLGFVCLKVYNALGQEVASLLNETISEGTYEVQFDARLHGQGSNLPSGIYFYTLEVDGNIIDTKRMILLK